MTTNFSIALPFREFVYFDRQKVEDFVSALLGGLPGEQKETLITKPAEIDGSIGISSSKLKIKKGGKELTKEELLSATDASLFERLYSDLESNNFIKTIDGSNAQQWDSLEVGEIVEIKAKVELSAIEVLFDKIMNFMPIVQTFAPEKMQDPNLKNIVNYFQTFKKDECNIRIIPLKAINEKYIFVSSLNEAKIRASKNKLIDEYLIFGGIRRRLAKNESFEIFNVIPGGISLPRNQLRDFLKSFKDIPQFLGSTPKMEDLRVSYPATVLTPVAIYR